ncbi:MAG TPA: 4Fe-4S dicluster domain-containing protein [bacterium]|nr:4Fe-4S dicluster domain-containing protein [bacterium]
MIALKMDLCDFCGSCVSVCLEDAIELFEARLEIDHDKCTECLRCIKVCPFRALEVKQ